MQVSRIAHLSLAPILLLATLASPAQTPQPERKLAPTVSAATLVIPAKAWKHLALAIAADHASRDQDCDREIAKALQIAPRFAQAYHLRAIRSLRARLFQPALDDALHVQHIDPHSPWLSTTLAGALNGLNRPGDALQILNTLQGPEAQAWQPAFERARAYIALKDTEAALAASAQALALAPPDHIDAHILRADALLLAQRTPEAIAQLHLYLANSQPQEHHDEVLTRLRAAQTNPSTALLAVDAPQPATLP
jgi:tetratricopeptide (TPR) repeat protein